MKKHRLCIPFRAFGTNDHLNMILVGFEFTVIYQILFTQERKDFKTSKVSSN